jgi:hypothetical protein
MSDGRVELRASEGLSIGGPVAVALPELPPGGGSAVAVIVTPLVADRHYLSVLVTGVVGGREHARAVMVPIGPAAAPAAARGPGEGSRAIRSLPMTETVH